MDDSASDTSHDEVKPAFYKISPEEMCKMKHSLKIMEDRLSSLWVITGCAHIDPILNEFEIVKASITEAEPASENIITPESSDSGSVPDSDKSTPAICPILIEGGSTLVVIRMLEQLEAQKNETSDRIVDFIDSHVPDAAEHDDKHELFVVIEEAMREDSDFVKEFEIRSKKIISDFITSKMKDAFSKELTEAFSKM
ncbi:hypothetical protein KCU93_g10241, partial [Aureobasidium melanogenum]